MNGLPPDQPRRRTRLALMRLLGVALIFGSAPAGAAAPMTVAQVEIEHLLTYVDGSRCEFYRNGTWYDAAKANAHLREKLGLLNAGNQIQSAEVFIDRVATKSAFTRLHYQVRCSGAAVNLDGWLRQELQRYRRCAAVEPCVSRVSRDTQGINVV